ncbi:uncharacterized protein LOC112270719 [Brachypodium distachyon]|uniref:uncharacterized protein LOC112270719 n=1 Tax=Brachypodium distachyon TaxID=15368 RepID=UPI000D0D08AC|nr:uncharacterized protein LOC112270719 [Brachypodium distachyon]|eukprot:XP_024314545.1 uncharacterized protein LOC112270719 [Brachypodium distachyon]
MLSPLPLREVSPRSSLYADDAIIFINPIRDEIATLLRILSEFGLATGLRINANKCSIAAIRCSGIDMDHVLQPFSGKRSSFPIRYLGLPLSLGRTGLAHLQHIIDRARAHFAGWRGRWINAGGRRALCSSVLSALPTYAMTALKLSKKFIVSLDKIRRRFIWGIEGNDLVGGKCKISWKKVLLEFVQAWSMLQHADILLLPGVPDTIRWTITVDGCYSARSAYRLHFEGHVRSNHERNVWRDDLGQHRQGIKSMFILICWAIWRERNSRVFNDKEISFRRICCFIKDEAREWAFAGAKAFRKLLWEPP